MNIDETTLIEIQDYINALDEKVGLKPETMEDVRKAISKHKSELKNLRLGFVVKPKGTLCLYEAGDTTSARCIHCGREKWEHKRA